MSSLWTPGGERPIARTDPSAPEPAQATGAPEASDEGPLSEEEVREQLAAMRDELARTPASAVVANHAYGLFELAALHLSLQPPQLSEAQLAIDAFAAVVEGLVGRLGEHEANLKEGLAQLRLAFVQIRAANLGRADPPQSPSG